MPRDDVLKERETGDVIVNTHACTGTTKTDLSGLTRAFLADLPLRLWCSSSGHLAPSFLQINRRKGLFSLDVLPPTPRSNSLALGINETARVQ
jgi:hypothetical protein